MRHLRAALRLYLSSPYTWRTSWRLTANGKAWVSFGKHFHLVRREGLLYIEPVAHR